MIHSRYHFTDFQKEAFYKILSARRDIRTYKPESVPNVVLEKILKAAHQAPSVGFMQPWNFLFIEERGLREQLYNHFKKVNKKASELYQDFKKESYLSLKLQGLLDAPHNILITCDTTRGGKHVLGRSTMPETDLYSTCLAVQNLWLAACAEGVGVGWVSILEVDFVRDLLNIPSSVTPVAYLTLGYPVEVSETPMLERVGWRRRENLKDLIFGDSWGRPKEGIVKEKESNKKATYKKDREGLSKNDLRASFKKRNRELTKPVGGLGDLEDLAAKMSDIQERLYPRASECCLLLAAGDHGITEEGVSAYDSKVTAKMVIQFISGGAAINALAKQSHLNLKIVDFGVNHDFEKATGLVHRKVCYGTKNFLKGPAMTMEQVSEAILGGRESVDEMGAIDLLALGEMGIGNTTSASAITSLLLKRPVHEVVGKGTGIGQKTQSKKIRVIERALIFHGPDGLETMEDLLSCLGGTEIAGLVGAIERASEKRMVVLLDGFITTVAALLAVRRTPSVRRCLVASHLSSEPAHGLLLEELGLSPLLDLKMRLGEGSGAALALPLLQSACRVFSDMSTFKEAGLSHPKIPEAQL